MMWPEPGDTVRWHGARTARLVLDVSSKAAVRDLTIHDRRVRIRRMDFESVRPDDREVGLPDDRRRRPPLIAGGVIRYNGTTGDHWRRSAGRKQT